MVDEDVILFVVQVEEGVSFFSYIYFDGMVGMCLVDVVMVMILWGVYQVNVDYIDGQIESFGLLMLFNGIEMFGLFLGYILCIKVVQF